MGKLNREEKLKKFLSYINNPLSNDSLSLLYDAHNIVFEKCDLFSDFTESLMDLIFETYLGDESFTSYEDKLNHFKWCWNKTTENFKKEDIYFSDNIDLFDYYLNFSVEVFYSSEKKDESLHKNILTLWNDVFNYKLTKTRSEVESFLDVYKMFDKSLKNT